MSKLEHPLSDTDLMAYADGELSGREASRAEAHIHECAHCARALADAKELSSQVTSWEIEEAPARIAQNVLTAMPKSLGWWTKSRVWVYGLSTTFAAALLVFVFVTPQLLRSRQAAFMQTGSNAKMPGGMAAAPLQITQGQQGQQGQGIRTRSGTNSYSAEPAPPMVIRTMTLNIVTKEFDTARTRIDAVVQQFQGYVDSLTLRSDPGTPRGLSARLRIPAEQADAALAELKKLGRLALETQNSSDITSQYVDLTARLSNARNTEQRLLGLLRERAGNLKDVVEMEREIASVRENIERMEAQQKEFSNKVDFTAIQLELSEDYHAELTSPASSTTGQLRNASVDGIRSAADAIVDIAFFVLRYGPTFLIWMAVIGPIAVLIWRRRKLS